MKIIAPGKLILSGEHSVVYGMPALAMAVDRYVTVSVADCATSEMLLDFVNLKCKDTLSWSALNALKERVKRNYQQFMQGHFNIRDVLQKPVELAQFALGLCAELLSLRFEKGLHFKIDSTIPIGCGLGSSAATILGMMYALMKYSNIESHQDFYETALQAENMQHGSSSGLDLYISMHGGCSFMQDKQFMMKPVPERTFYLLNTGQPSSTTGECVMHVRKYFHEASIWREFSDVTIEMSKALDENNAEQLNKSIRANHQLLKTIQVVPEKINQCIEVIESFGGAAKICGAGAVHGDAAGIVMVSIDDQQQLMKIANDFGFEVMTIRGESRGVHVAI